MSELDALVQAQFSRLLANMIRIGTIEAADYATAKARVRLGDLVTDWLPWMVERAGPDRDWVAPELGEQVVLFCPSGNPELGIIGGSLYQTAHAANGDSKDLRRVTFGDGTVCEYDRAGHKLNITIPEAGGELNVTTPGKVTISAATQVNLLSAAEINLTAGAKISLTAPLIALNGNIVQDAGVGGTFHLKSSQITIEGPVVQTEGDLTSDGISLQHHTHGGVDPGGSNTAQPN